MFLLALIKMFYASLVAIEREGDDTNINEHTKIIGICSFQKCSLMFINVHLCSLMFINVHHF